ncbi:hypothetical protein Kisp01_51780 [Kineosporia sp. NBRC 101677]|uniref:hypothetical protein n=1 Tax=Kineosporia sp. NBRC 101677 TaxID=3032197 RepID=UPI0024A29E55|nr:hypothetical protein [Kineosporia sp. NBRC 101677]GLY18164.1 hypothetical protein Kisp01_51780 [Kineosporia sp. NBRC 101677]
MNDALIWATRGRSWGFRFLLNGGLPDPLAEYERAFADVADEPAACHRGDGRVALRFPDPEGRRDTAGRPIPHEFVVSGPLAETINSLDDALHTIWPMVADTYAGIWDTDHPPTPADLRFDAQ